MVEEAGLGEPDPDEHESDGEFVGDELEGCLGGSAAVHRLARGAQAHYASLSQRMGYTVPIPEQTVNLLGYQHLGQNQIADALSAFRFNLECHPGSANAYDSLGEALEKAGKFAEAKEAYAQAAARGLIENTELTPEEVVKKSLTIAGDLCIYTNQSHTIEVIDW